MERRLAAILSADVVGYSRLMAADEKATHERLKALWKDLIEPKITEHHGRMVKLMGDGALVEFASVVDAIQCAPAIQTGIAEHEAGVPEEDRIAFRIGINIGDIIIEGDDIYGSSVNLAVRLQALADAGGICVSQTAYDHVRDKVNLAFEAAGEHAVKNVPEPVVVYRVVRGRANSNRLPDPTGRPKARVRPPSQSFHSRALSAMSGGSDLRQKSARTSSQTSRATRICRLSPDRPHCPSKAALPMCAGSAGNLGFAMCWKAAFRQAAAGSG